MAPKNPCFEKLDFVSEELEASPRALQVLYGGLRRNNVSCIFFNIKTK
jgi:hypothetical protein